MPLNGRCGDSTNKQTILRREVSMLDHQCEFVSKHQPYTYALYDSSIFSEMTNTHVVHNSLSQINFMQSRSKVSDNFDVIVVVAFLFQLDIKRRSYMHHSILPLTSYCFLFFVV